MKKIILVLILTLGIIWIFSVFAHGIEEEERGKAIFEKLESKELNCESLTDDDFEVLGEYFMGQMTGDSHEAMNDMMIQMMGEEGEEQMHIAMGKRMSNCEPDAPMPQSMMNSGTMPMMMGSGMMGWNNWGFGAGWGWFSWIFMILFWILIIVWIVVPIKWLIDQITRKNKEKSALDILKERYVRSEISKEEFEEKKKDLI